MRIILILSILFLLLGCSTTKQSNLIIDEENKRLYVFPTDENLKYCDELPELKGKKFSDLYKHSSVEVPKAYYDCALKQQLS